MIASRKPVGQRTLWVAWEDDSSIRSRVLAEQLHAKYCAFTRFDHSRAFRWLRYPVAIVQTVWAFFRHRPHVLVVQNPSIVLAFQAALLKPLFRYRLAIDLHTPFLPTSGLQMRFVGFLHLYGLRHADVVIVSNAAYQKRVARQTSCSVLVLPDMIPSLDGQKSREPLKGRQSVLYICTFSVDEPWREVLAAARMLPADTYVYISGRSGMRQQDVPDNVVLTGFLPLATYQSLLRSVDAILVLTTAEENLVCGGYEAVAAGKPLILSDTEALRSYFSRGTVFTSNTAVSIASAISNALGDSKRLASDVAELRDELNTSWRERWREVVSNLYGESSSDKGPRPSAMATAP